jgi:hypothetical protein
MHIISQTSVSAGVRKEREVDIGVDTGFESYMLIGLSRS